MDYIPYNSRKTYHKSPFGAVPCGGSVTFRVILPREVGCRGVRLLLHADDAPVQIVDAVWDGMQGEGEEWWRIVYTPREAGLFWYSFMYDTDFGSVAIRRYDSCCGRIAQSGGEWQLTVYDEAVQTPAWIRGGILYQIFPDRFYASGEKKPGDFSARVLRRDWGAEPMWEPDANGRITRYDFFGGDLAGVRQKLPYLQSLGVTCIYLNPIFEAASNHRYDTGDYEKIDPLLGSEADLRELCAQAHACGIRVILDGVFSHTGDDSRYFNKYGHYNSVGAYQSKRSPFAKWYKFRRWPDSYESWWGIDILPEVREEEPSYIRYISGIARKWLAVGADGWRLDVADELPDEFLDAFYKAVKTEKPDAYILGEVWEDASCKISYGRRRRYLFGGQMDSVMNYPFLNAVLQFLRTGSAEHFLDAVLTVLENYPPYSIHCLMNPLGTHDTARALTRLLCEGGCGRGAWKNGEGRFSGEALEKGKRLLRAAAALQFTLPGVPCIYYADEAGVQGGEDPYNRGCFPWGSEDAALLSFYRAVGALRRANACFADGEFIPISGILGCAAFARVRGSSRAVTIVNRNEHPIDYYLPPEWQDLSLRIGGERTDSRTVHLDGCEAAILSAE